MDVEIDGYQYVRRVVLDITEEALDWVMKQVLDAQGGDERAFIKSIPGEHAGVLNGSIMRVRPPCSAEPT
jgi:hypothetical protein